MQRDVHRCHSSTSWSVKSATRRGHVFAWRGFCSKSSLVEDWAPKGCVCETWTSSCIPNSGVWHINSRRSRCKACMSSSVPRCCSKGINGFVKRMRKGSLQAAEWWKQLAKIEVVHWPSLGEHGRKTFRRGEAQHQDQHQSELYIVFCARRNDKCMVPGKANIRVDRLSNCTRRL